VTVLAVRIVDINLLSYLLTYLLTRIFNDHTRPTWHVIVCAV